MSVDLNDAKIASMLGNATKATGEVASGLSQVSEWKELITQLNLLADKFFANRNQQQIPVQNSLPPVQTNIPPVSSGSVPPVNQALAQPQPDNRKSVAVDLLKLKDNLSKQFELLNLVPLQFKEKPLKDFIDEYIKDKEKIIEIILPTCIDIIKKSTSVI